MLCVVTGVGFLIHVYSVGYMGEEEGYWRFFAYMNLFLFFMLTLVLADNFLLMFVGWEGVGLASYLLIGFYYTRDSAANAGKKAFIVNRIGDFGFLIAMFLLIAHFGTLELQLRSSARSPPIPRWQGGFLTAIALFSSSAHRQIRADSPLRLAARRHGRPDSGLRAHPRRHHGHRRRLHRRAHPRHLRPLPVRAAWSWPSSAWPPRFFAATIGLVQTDIKRVLAYSTISQLGYMFLGCGVAAYSAGIFHLVTHAFFKALLFLAAGSVIHALSGEQDMRAMGGLRQKIPITFWTMTVAVLAISGFPPLAGFVSKDEILYQTFIAPNGGKILWAVGLLTAGLTSFYMFRLWYLTFFGESRTAAHEEEAAVHARRGTKLILEADPFVTHTHPVHESSWVMLGPLVILAILSVIGGWIGWPEALGGSNWFAHFLEPAAGALPAPSSAESHLTELILALVSTFVAAAGWLAAHIMYYVRPELPARLAAQFPARYALLKNKYWVDEIYAALVVAPVLFVARWILGVLIDRGLIDGGSLTAGYSAQGLGALVARIQSGNIRSYAGWLALFAAALLAASYFGWTTHFFIQ